MWQFLIGLLCGLGSMYVKDYLVPSKEKSKLQLELDNVLNENEKLRASKKESDRLVEDLKAELSRLKKQIKTKEDNNDDVLDELDAEKRKNKKLSAQIEELSTKLADYQAAYNSLEAEIRQLKK